MREWYDHIYHACLCGSDECEVPSSFIAFLQVVRARSLAVMLKVEKDLLQVETAQQISKLRQLELQYYIDHIGGIQTMATLLAGFSFTALISSESLDIDKHAVIFHLVI